MYPLIKDYYPEVFKCIFPMMQEQAFIILNYYKDKAKKIIIFGSSVTTRCGQDSDLDVCVVINEEIDLNFKRVWRTDILDITEDDFEKDSKEINSVYYDVKLKGVEIFGR